MFIDVFILLFMFLFNNNRKYGDVGDVYIPRNPRNNESRGFAFVRFYDRRDAEKAMDNLDGYR